MFMKILAVFTVLLLLSILISVNAKADKGERIFYNITFSITIVGVFLGGVLDLF